MKIVSLLIVISGVSTVPSFSFAAPKADRRVVTPGGDIETKINPKSTGITVPVVAMTAFVRVLHAVPSGPQLDVFVGSLKIASNRGFTGITSYVPVKSGKNPLKVLGAGKTSPVIVTDSFTFGRGKYYTVAIYGKKAPLLLSTNESSGKENIEKARVRVVHLSPGASELLVTAPSTRGDLGYAKFISKPLEYGKSGSKLIAPKTTTLQIRGADNKLIKETPALTFEAGKRYSAFIIGEIEGSKMNALDVLVKSAGN